MIAYAPTHHFLVHGRNGSFIKYGMDPQEDFLRSPNPPSGTDWGAQWGVEPEENWGTLTLVEGGARKIKTEIGDYRNYYINVRDAVAGKAELDVSPGHALNVMRCLELAHQSHRQRPYSFVG